MAYKIYFDTFEEFLNFIDYSTDLYQWGCRKFELTNINGATMNIDTKEFVSGNSRSYIAFGTLKDYIRTFYNNNDKQPIRVDVKLVCPLGIKDTIDPNNYYENFFIALYSYNGDTNNYLACTFQENGGTLMEDEYASFSAYVRKIYDGWKTYYATTYE